MADPAVVYTSSVEALIRALGTRLDEHAHQKFAALGVPLRGKLQPAYPREQWIAACVYGGELLFAGLEPAEQRRRLGRRFIDGYAETMAGRALFTIMRVLGARRSLARIEQNLRTGNNYAKARMVETEAGAELHLEDQPHPEWYQGMVERALEVMGAKNVTVTQLRREANASAYRIEFQ